MAVSYNITRWNCENLIWFCYDLASGFQTNTLYFHKIFSLVESRGPLLLSTNGIFLFQCQVHFYHFGQDSLAYFWICLHARTDILFEPCDPYFCFSASPLGIIVMERYSYYPYSISAYFVAQNRNTIHAKQRKTMNQEVILEMKMFLILSIHSYHSLPNLTFWYGDEISNYH